MIIGVGSSNPVKVLAVKTVFNKIFGKNISVKSISVKTSIGPQPMSLNQIIIGGIERALKSLEYFNAEYGIGIEAGFYRVPATITGFLEQQICVIVDREYGMTIGGSSSFEFPPTVLKKIFSGEIREAEEEIIRITNISSIGEKQGAVGFLTQNMVTRLDLSIQSVLMALIPRINRRIYNVEWPNAKKVLEKMKKL